MKYIFLSKSYIGKHRPKKTSESTKTPNRCKIYTVIKHVKIMIYCKLKYLYVVKRKGRKITTCKTNKGRKPTTVILTILVRLHSQKYTYTKIKESHLYNFSVDTITHPYTESDKTQRYRLMVLDPLNICHLLINRVLRSPTFQVLIPRPWSTSGKR